MYRQAANIVGMCLDRVNLFKRVVIENTDQHVILKSKINVTRCKINKNYTANLTEPVITQFLRGTNFAARTGISTTSKVFTFWDVS